MWCWNDSVLTANRHHDSLQMSHTCSIHCTLLKCGTDDNHHCFGRRHLINAGKVLHSHDSLNIPTKIHSYLFPISHFSFQSTVYRFQDFSFVMHAFLRCQDYKLLYQSILEAEISIGLSKWCFLEWERQFELKRLLWKLALAFEHSLNCNRNWDRKYRRKCWMPLIKRLQISDDLDICSHYAGKAELLEVLVSLMVLTVPLLPTRWSYRWFEPFHEAFIFSQNTLKK